MIKILFQGRTIDEAHTQIKEYAHNHLKMQLIMKRGPGRPKMTPEAHLGLVEVPTLLELQELLKQLYSKLGLVGVQELLTQFHVSSLSDLPITSYVDFKRIALDKIKQPREEKSW